MMIASSREERFGRRAMAVSRTTSIRLRLLVCYTLTRIDEVGSHFIQPPRLVVFVLVHYVEVCLVAKRLAMVSLEVNVTVLSDIQDSLHG